MTLRKSITSGILYTGISRYSGIIISIVIGAILARLLTPSEFGVVALITVFISFFNILSTAGIGPAIIQKKDLNKEELQTIFIFTAFLGLSLGLLFFFSAELISSFYGNKTLIPLVRLLSLTVFFTSITIVPNALLLKKLKFKQIGYATITVQLFSGVFTVILAYRGFSYYALVFKSVFDGLFTFILLYWLSPIKLNIKFKKSAITKIIRFSTFQYLFSFTHYFSRSSDNLLIGKFINPEALGYYDKSYQLMILPVKNLTHVITPVLLPVLSEFHEDKNKILNTYIKVVRILSLIGFPLSVFLYFSASEIIFILYGQQWEDSIPVFKILALTIGLQMLLSSSGAIFQAVNRTDLLFYSGLLSAVSMIIGICYGIFIGQNIESVGYGLLIAFVINFFQGYYFLIKRALDGTLTPFFKLLLFPVFISLVLSVLLWLYSYLEIQETIIELAGKILITGFTFIAFVISRKEYRVLLKKEWLKIYKTKKQ